MKTIDGAKQSAPGCNKKSFSVVRYDPSTYEEHQLFVYEVVTDSQPDIKPIILHEQERNPTLEIQSPQSLNADDYHSDQDKKFNTDDIDKSLNSEEGNDNDASVEVKSTSSRKSMSGRSRVEGWHICTECSYTTKYRWMFRRHMKVHTEKPLPICPICGSTFKSLSALQLHSRRHATPNHECSVCNAKFVGRKELETHTRATHPTVKLYKCSECVYETVEFSKMKRHSLVHTGHRPFQCPECSYAAIDKANLKRHMQSHLAKEFFKCNVCPARFCNAELLVQHKSRHKTYSCDKCSATFARSTDYRRHFKALHSTSKQITCKKCLTIFHDKYQYSLHLKTHQPGEVYKCKLCNFEAKTSLSIENHTTKKHLPRKKLPRGSGFKCNICSAELANSDELVVHKNWHKTECCKKCPASFVRPSDLRRHEILLHSERQLTCKKCQSTFHDKYHYQLHQESHK